MLDNNGDYVSNHFQNTGLKHAFLEIIADTIIFYCCCCYCNITRIINLLSANLLNNHEKNHPQNLFL